MKQLIYGFLCLILLSCGLSCKKDYLKKAPDEDLNIDKVFSERRYAEAFLSSAYSNLPTMANAADDATRNPFTGASDEMEITFLGAYSHLLNSGSWSADYYWPDIWGYMYEGVRKTNLFIDNIDKVPMDEKEKMNWKGEAIFLRAYYHFIMARIHGPIPIADHTYTLEEDFTKIKRAPIDQVIAFITTECDRAAPMLDYQVTADKLGRATRVACLALKAQALLYMASPLWNGNPDYTGLKNKDGEALFPQFNGERWRNAANAAKAAIDQSEANGYGLFRAPDNDPVNNYQQLFLARNNKEVLFARNLAVNSHFERCANPVGYGGFSIFCPTQELVDAYEMANGQQPITGYNPDGSPVVNPASGYQETGFAASASSKNYHPAGIRNMYVNREPRFYASINYNGAIWKGRGIQFWFTGLDGRQRTGSDYCVSGYLQKKYVNPTSNIPGNIFSLNTFIYFRLGELYLNYAEALNEADGPVADVYKYMNAIRDRSGLPGLPAGLTKDAMRERIRHERQIELAFEAHRYFDTHRWKIAAQVDNREIHGMNIGAGTSLTDENYYKRVVIEKRVFLAPKHYLWPIQQAEINKNQNLVQNVGW
ncbi:RagB/SusD family nutrient uptake outer membrane protein [Pedobacter yulinensis]|uniref:RagB/SusD family nutrient uptake outer membrane protein n=1 Tax=Pedobacter yulinensis TaxID=2126353 RepID=A0A2T3HMX6_9SPHI|nr:RagB/SusD family nutrient uptake outer membrane protein [Pedobacter yulinensis]PST83795.1 RagB/SusD family nutrient uptake outer membrane protein [Pedobacter yulinensis]